MKDPATGKVLSMQEAMHIASESQASGQLQRSEILLRGILEKEPNHADALHLLGVIAYQAGQMNMALELIKKAISVNDKVSLFHSNYGEMCRLNKQFAEAVAHGEKAVAIDSTSASAHSNLGIAYFDIKEYDRAQACQMRALSLDPNFPPALNNMGSIFREKKMFVEAMGYYERAFHASGRKYAEPMCNLSTLLIEEDRVDEAFPIIAQALAVQPNHPEALCNLGGAYLGREEAEKAYACFSKALSVDPNHASALGGMARVFQDGNQIEDSLNYVNKAIELEPNKDSFYMLRAQAYQELGRIDEAVSDFDKAIALNSESTKAIVAKARLFFEQGEMDEGKRILEQALIVDKSDISALSQLILTYKIKENDPNMTTMVELFESGTVNKINDKIAIHFALGKCYEDIGSYDKAFTHFLEGNALKRQLFDYDPQEEQQRNDEIISTFSADYIHQREGLGSNTDIPIFIVGMPRSGTTLVEQIISSHPSVYGAGELHYLPLIVMNAANEQKKSMTQLMGSLTSEIIKKIGDKYLNLIRLLDKDALHISDKMPNNFLNIGLIKIVFPNAKIIHLQRNALDVCLSGFERLFHLGQRHSYNLAEQGKNYREYARVMEHWRSVLPENAFFEIKYEDLIEDTEMYARQLIHYCGLEWDAACLAFYDTKRRVKTASITQVRQPIYKTSVEKWRRYEKYLGPLREALGEFNPE